MGNLPVLKPNDIIYLSRKGIAKFNYYLRQIDPLLRFFISGEVLYDYSTPDN